MMALRWCVLAVASTVLFAGCAKAVTAPSTPRVCYLASEQKDKTWQFHEVAKDRPNIEQCAVELERMRLKFLRLGGSNSEIIGAYHGRFIFLQQEGIFFSTKLDGVRYLALRRYNGNLVMPGAIPE